MSWAWSGPRSTFFDHEHREIVDLYPALLEEAAKYQVLVNFHGANKPTGETRTWPNELVREGVRGMESSSLKARARHDDGLAGAIAHASRGLTGARERGKAAWTPWLPEMPEGTPFSSAASQMTDLLSTTTPN